MRTHHQSGQVLAISPKRVSEHVVVSAVLLTFGITPGRKGYMHRHPVGMIIVSMTFASLCVVGRVPARAQTQPDNTKVNTRDRDKAAVTADQQKENVADRDLTQRIRRALTRDKTLSSYARNVKIVTQGGQVTLKGPVRTEEEKQTVERAAAEVAGTDHVTSQLSIAPKKQ